MEFRYQVKDVSSDAGGAFEVLDTYRKESDQQVSVSIDREDAYLIAASLNGVDINVMDDKPLPLRRKPMIGHLTEGEVMDNLRLNYTSMEPRTAMHGSFHNSEDESGHNGAGIMSQHFNRKE